MKKQFKESYFKNQTFRKTFLMFLSMIIIILTIFFISYARLLFSNINKQNEQSVNEIVSEISQELNKYTSALQSLRESIQKTRWTSKYMSGYFPDEFTSYKHTEYCTDLRLLKNGYANVQRIALIFPFFDTAVTDSSWTTIDDCVNSIKHSYKIDISKIVSDVITSKNTKQSQNTNSHFVIDNYMILIQELEITSNPRGYALLIMPIDKIQNYVAPYLNDGKDTRMASIQLSFYDNGKSTEIFTQKDTQNINNQKVNKKVIIKNVADMVCTFEFYDGLMPNDKMQIVFSSIVAILFVLLGFLLSYIISIISFRPLDMIFRKVHNGVSAIPIESAEQATRVFDDMIQKNAEMQQLTQHYIENGKKQLLKQLLRGYFLPKCELGQLRQSLEEMEVPFNETDFFRVVLLNVEEDVNISKEKDLQILQKISAFSERVSLNCLPTELGNHEFAIIISNSKEEKLHDEHICKFVLELRETVEALDIIVEISIGNIRDGLIGISSSYHHAIQSRIEKGSDEIKKANGGYTNIYYPHDWENQLYTAIKSGNNEVTEKILNEILMQNDSNSLSEDDEIVLASLIYRTMDRLMKENMIDTQRLRELCEQLLIPSIGDKRWEYIKEIGNEICKIMLSINNQRENAVIERELVLYVNMHYRDCNISLKELAERFKTSVSAISRSFKKATDVNFSEYLTRLRMECAKELLLNNDNSVHMVAMAVGYENDYSFRRAFERYEGMSLHDFRKVSQK